AGRGPGPAYADGKIKMGHDRLAQARLELKNGTSHISRRMAEELAADPSYGVQAEAFALIRSIDVEDRNQAMLAADRNAQAALEAFKIRDYRMAQSIMSTLEFRFVNPRLQSALREIASTKEMQDAMAAAEVQRLKPSPIRPVDAPGVAAAGGGQPGRASVGDLSPHALRAPDDLANAKAMDEIEFQKLRGEGLQIQQAAIDYTARGDFTRGLEVLREYLNRLNAHTELGEQ